MMGKPLARDSFDFDYDVATPIDDSGTLLRMAPVGEAPWDERGSRPCYEKLYGRQTPCEDCPLLATARDRDMKTWIAVRFRDEADLEVVTVKSVSAGVARLSVRQVSSHAQRAIHDAKIENVANKARLSARERSVLRYIAMGRSLDDMAKILGISPRTVKFHQANVLEKVGADSRQDLVRLICG